MTEAVFSLRGQIKNLQRKIRNVKGKKRKELQQQIAGLFDQIASIQGRFCEG